MLHQIEDVGYTNGGVILTYPSNSIIFLSKGRVTRVKYIKFYMLESIYNVHIANNEPGGMKLLQCSDSVLTFYNNIEHINVYNYSYNLSNDQLLSIIPSLLNKFYVQRLSCIKYQEFDPIEYPTNILYLVTKDDAIASKLVLL